MDCFQNEEKYWTLGKTNKRTCFWLRGEAIRLLVLYHYLLLKTITEWSMLWNFNAVIAGHFAEKFYSIAEHQ